TETRVGAAKLQERGLIKYLGVIAQKGLRIHSRAFSSSTELPLTHEFRGRGRKKGVTLSETAPIRDNMRLQTILLFGFSKHRLLLGLLLVTIPTLAQVPTGAASFVKTDTTTAGTWRSAYGADGNNVIGDLASAPAYVTVTPAGNSSYVWASVTVT